MGGVTETYSYQHYLFYTFSFVLIGSLLAATSLQNILPLILPAILLIGFAGTLNLRRLYAFFFLLLPFSIEISFAEGLGSDLPAEPFMIGLSLIGLFLFANKFAVIDARYIRHPITVLLILHLVWIALATFFSEDFVVSFKYLLAKIWYIIPFYFLAIYLLREVTTVRNLIKGLLISLSVAIAFVMISHAGDSFSFDKINQAVSPLFRNHVNYACILTLFIPYLWYLYITSKAKSNKLIYTGFILVFLAAIYLSYTRAAYVAIAIAIGAYFIVRWRLTKVIILTFTIITIAGISYMTIDNNYLEFKPEYEKAITHTKFDNLLEATTKLEDISTVERFYRWVAGGHMVADKPLFGFGPATFYFFYQSYTVTGFQTYVSDNTEKSGIHNYYLMTAVEQGIIGCLIFICFCFIVITKGDEIYHAEIDENKKSLVMAALLSFIIICAILIINDMVEAAKVGPFFFLAPAIILIYGVASGKERFTN